MGLWATLQETDYGMARAREGRRGRERVREEERVCYLHVKLASLAEKGNGKNFNVILLLLTGAMS